MFWNIKGSMRGDGVPVAPGMLDSEAVAAGVLQAEPAIMGLFQETGLQDPRAWYIWRTNGVTMGTMPPRGSVPRRCRRQRYVAVS